MIIIAAALTVLCVVCILAYGSVAHRLEAQREAERWQGESETAFAQISCFLPADGTRHLGQYIFLPYRDDEKAARGRGGYRYRQHSLPTRGSTFGKVKVSNGNKRSADVTVTAVGGNYF